MSDLRDQEKLPQVGEVALCCNRNVIDKLVSWQEPRRIDEESKVVGLKTQYVTSSNATLVTEVPGWCIALGWMAEKKSQILLRQREEAQILITEFWTAVKHCPFCGVELPKDKNFEKKRPITSN